MQKTKEWHVSCAYHCVTSARSNKFVALKFNNESDDPEETWIEMEQTHHQIKQTGKKFRKIDTEIKTMLLAKLPDTCSKVITSENHIIVALRWKDVKKAIGEFCKRKFPENWKDDPSISPNDEKLASAVKQDSSICKRNVIGFCALCRERGHHADDCVHGNQCKGYCSSCGQKQHTKSCCPEINCCNCGKKDHATANCPTKKKSNMLC